MFSSKMPDCDFISIGPDILEGHSPDERMSISSHARMCDFFVEFLKEILGVLTLSEMVNFYRIFVPNKALSLRNTRSISRGSNTGGREKTVVRDVRPAVVSTHPNFRNIENVADEGII